MTDYPCLLRNASTRPVELHLSGGVTVLPPGAEMRIENGDAYCEALLARGVLTSHAAPLARSPETAKETGTKKAEPTEYNETGKSDSAEKAKTAKRTERVETTEKTDRTERDRKAEQTEKAKSANAKTSDDTAARKVAPSKDDEPGESK